MSLVTRGLGDITLVTRGLGGGQIVTIVYRIVRASSRRTLNKTSLEPVLAYSKAGGLPAKTSQEILLDRGSFEYANTRISSETIKPVETTEHAPNRMSREATMDKSTIESNVEKESSEQKMSRESKGKAEEYG